MNDPDKVDLDAFLVAKRDLVDRLGRWLDDYSRERAPATENDVPTPHVVVGALSDLLALEALGSFMVSRKELTEFSGKSWDFAIRLQSIRERWGIDEPGPDDDPATQQFWNDVAAAAARRQ